MFVAAILIAWAMNRNEYPYKYHVVYKWANGFGSHSLSRKVKINSMAEVKSVQEWVTETVQEEVGKDTKVEKLVLTNWILLK